MECILLEIFTNLGKISQKNGELTMSTDIIIKMKSNIHKT